MRPDILAVYAVGVAEAIGLPDQHLAAIRRAALEQADIEGHAGEVLAWVRARLQGADRAADPVLESAFARVATVVQPLE